MSKTYKDDSRNKYQNQRKQHAIKHAKLNKFSSQFNDFDKKSISFLKYSMPTKASEYMISGTPVLVYSHGETAVSKFFMLRQPFYIRVHNFL